MWFNRYLSNSLPYPLLWCWLCTNPQDKPTFVPDLFTPYPPQALKLRFELYRPDDEEIDIQIDTFLKKKSS